MRYAKLISKTFIILLITSNAFSDIIRVPGDKPTIQAAIDYATDGDTILVSSGTYTGVGNFNISWDASMKHLVIKSEDGPENCVIDCQRNGRGFLLINGQNNNDIIDGLKIINGLAMTVAPDLTGGGAILCESTSPQIMNCILENNLAGGSGYGSYYADGGAIDCVNNASPIIKDNIIRYNEANHTGGGLHFHSSSGSVERNIIIYNICDGCYGGGGISLILNSNPTISYNLIAKNTAMYYTQGGYGGGLICMNANPIIVNNTIVDNSTEHLTNNNLGEGGGVRVRGLPTPIIKNCIIWGNIAVTNLENIDFQYPQWTIDISYSDIENGIGGINTVNPATNFDALPMFVDPANDDYHLQNGSPCIDQGDPASPLDPDGTRCDMGAFYFNQSSSVKNSETINTRFYLYQNYPNPFNNSTVIPFQIEKRCWVTMAIYNIKGELEKVIINEERSPGQYNVILNSTNLTSGIHFYRLSNNNFSEVKKMIILK